MRSPVLLGNVLTEIKSGIGHDWAKYPVLGATREGVAPAKERPGKNPERYKPVVPGTIFYNPMRILIGSVAFVDEEHESGITSPDYVVFKGKEGSVDSRWFYYWLRSPLGHQTIVSLARGAVRERMLFARLAKAEVQLPDYETQKKTSLILAQAQREIAAMKVAIGIQLYDLQQLPHRIIADSVERSN
jgi:type I restriction enzyme S subunit